MMEEYCDCLAFVNKMCGGKAGEMSGDIIPLSSVDTVSSDGNTDSASDWLTIVGHKNAVMSD